METLLDRRSEFACLGLDLHQVFEKFRDVTSLQDAVLEWLANYKRGCTPDEAADIIREVSANPHKRLLRGLMGQLSVETQRVMTHVYKWTKYAAEPLTLEILAEAIRYSLPQEMAQLQYIRNHEEFGRFVERSMGGIILRVGRDIRFSDDSFYEISGIGELCDEHENAYSSHADMAAVCLRYLLGTEGQKMLASLSVESQGMDDPSWSPIMLPRHSLVSYALRFWTFHYQAAGDYRPIDLATDPLQDTRKRGAWAEAFYVVSNPFKRSHKGYISPLPYMAMFGLDDLVLRQIEGEASQNGSNQDHWLAIAEAARNGHEKTVALLLEHTDTDVAGLGEALRWAASYGEGGALDCLISKAQELEKFQWPPFILDRAVVAGLENLVSALIEAGYDLDEDSGTGDAVHTAIEYGQDRVLKILLDSGRVDLGLQNGRAEFAWVLAVQAGNTASIQHMLDAGAGLDDSDVAKDVLLWAVWWGSHVALRMLIDAQVFCKAQIRSQATTSGEHYAFPLEIAVAHAFRTCTHILLDNDADPNAVSIFGGALWQAVVQIVDDTILLMLLDKGANLDWSRYSADGPRYEHEEMLLIQAISTGRQSLVEILLDHGADLNVADPGRTEYDTPLSWAIKCGYSDIVNLLLERGADPNLVSEEKGCWSPLFNASFLGSDTTLIKSLIKRGANIRWTRSDGWSVLHAAYNSPKTLSVLLRNGVDINATDNRNWTALMVAVENKEIESIKVLLWPRKQQADLEVMSTDEVTQTALHLASRIGYSEAARLLLRAGADVNCQRNDGKFPIESIDWSQWDAECEDMVTLMLERRLFFAEHGSEEMLPNLRLSDNEGNTVLHKIRRAAPVSVAVSLVDKHAPVNAVNDLGYTPLVIAVTLQNYDVARYLTTLKGVRSDFYHPEFGSILHLAAKRCSLEMVKQLVRTGAESSIVDPVYGESVLYSAIENGADHERKIIIEYLVEEVGVDVNARGGEWVCPLMLVVGKNGYKSSDEWPYDASLLKYLLRHGARTDIADSLGRTVTHWAVMKLDTYEAISFFGSEAGLTTVDNYGRTPLTLCGLFR